MPSYTYKAMTGEGEQVGGILTAENYQVALRQLEEKQLFPVKVTEGIQESGISLFGGKVKTSHLTVFYGQLADLLRAGVPMLRALDVLGRQSSQGPLARIVRELREDVAGGTSLGDSMSKHPRAFSDLHSSMVRAGEQGGFLEDVLQRIAIFCEKQDELRGKVVGSMIYPCILVVVGALVILAIMLVVVPSLREHLRPETFNVLTHIVFAATDILKEHYIALLATMAVVAVTLSSLAKTTAGQAYWEQIKLRAPLVGKIITTMAICRFCRILGTLLHNGVPILQAIRVSKDSAGNKVLAEVIANAGENVKKGASLSQPLQESGLFPLDVVDMISVAEESNNLETVLIQIADTNEKRTSSQVEFAVRILEPMMLVFMAGVVLIILMALLLPMLTMGSAITG